MYSTEKNISKTDESHKTFHKNIHNLQICIDPRKWEPIAFEENKDDGYLMSPRTLNGNANTITHMYNQHIPKCEKVENNTKVISTNDENNQENDIKQRANTKRRCTIKRKWFVLAAGFVFICLCAGIPFQLSIIYVDLLEEFGATNAETSLVQSVCIGLFFGGGLISGIIVNRFGVRVAGTVSGICTCLGLSVSYFAMNISFLVVTVGVISGFGFSMGYVCSSSCVGQHFTGKSKLLALSFVSFGSGAGAMAFPYIFEYLIQMYGWRGSLLIMGGTSLNFIPSALVSIPPSDKFNAATQSKVNKSTKINKVRDDECVTEGSSDYTKPHKDSIGLMSGIKVVFKNKLFLLYSLGLSIALSALTSSYIFFIDVFQSKGLDRSTSVFVVLICNIINALSRLLPGLMKQIPHVSVLAIPVVYLAVGCVATAMFPIADSYEMLLLVSSLYGLSLGGTVTTISVSTVKLIGVKHFPTGLGVLLSLCSIGALSAGPISGKFRDISGSYDLSFYTVSGALGVACVIMIITAILRKNTRTQDRAFEMEIVVQRRMSRKRSSIIPWRRSLDFIR